MKTYLITWAQNQTPIHQDFLAALKQHAGKLLVVAGHYHNPTSRFEAFADGEAAWAPEVLKHLVDEETVLCPNLKLFANIRTQPTAGRPLSGLEVYVGKNSAIIGHPKRAFSTVATTTRWPRVLASTGAVTLPNYSKSKAGAKGAAHHVLGALVVEVDTDGAYFIRQITWDAKTGSYTDLDRTYFADRVEDAKPATSLVVGDLHAVKADHDALNATYSQIARLRPQHVCLHDVFDCETRNHHTKSLRERFALRFGLVKAEVTATAELLAQFESVCRTSGSEIHVVRSNHDEALDRWLDEHDVRSDLTNNPYYHELWSAVHRYYETHRHWPMALSLECSHDGTSAVDTATRIALSKVDFLEDNESLMLQDVEHGFHGHRGTNGAKGTTLGYSKLGAKVTLGHEHAPCIVDGVYRAGHVSKDDHGYNKLPNGWLRANVVQYADGKRSLLTILGSRWHGKKRAR